MSGGRVCWRPMLSTPHGVAATVDLGSGRAVVLVARPMGRHWVAECYPGPDWSEFGFISVAAAMLAAEEHARGRGWLG